MHNIGQGSYVVEKVALIIVYLIAGAAIIFPLMTGVSPKGWSYLSGRRFVSVAATIAVVVFLLGPSTINSGIIILMLISTVAVFIFSKKITDEDIRWTSFPLLFLVVLTSSTIAWWLHGLPLLFKTVWVFLCLVLFALLLISVEDKSCNYLRWSAPVFLFITAASIDAFSTGLYANPWVSWLSWHHWGAYIGPAQLVRAGVRPFFDVPLQYGLGPTSLIAMTCRRSCWFSMYALVASLNLAYGVLLIYAAIKICGGKQNVLLNFLIVFLVFICVYVWTAYPPNMGSPSLTPSVAGFRFLPLTALLCVLLNNRDEPLLKHKVWFSQLIWTVGLIWSPESAFQVTVLWWPYCVWVRCTGISEKERRFKAFFLANAKLAIWAIGIVVTFTVFYKWILGVYPTLNGYLAYVLYPPGAMLANPYGIVCFFGIALVTAIVSIYQLLYSEQEDAKINNVLVTTLSAYGAASYFLGRSHDNNLLNISVFFLLMLLALRELRQFPWTRLVACISLSALLAYPILGGWGQWSGVIRAGNLVEVRPTNVVRNYSYMQPAGVESNRAVNGRCSSVAGSNDAATGMKVIVSDYHEPVTVFDPAMNLEGSVAGSVWSAFQGPENYAYLPPPVRREFLKRVADRLKKPGWVLMCKDFNGSAWLSDYDAVYRRDKTLDFGEYYGIRYVPK